MVILLIPLGRVLPQGGSSLKVALRLIYVEDIVRWGVWLGRHIC